MSLSNYWKKINPLRSGSGEETSEVISFGEDGKIEKFPALKKFYISIIIILTACLSFGLGRLSSGEGRAPIKIEFDNEIVGSQESQNLGTTNSVLNSAPQAAAVVKALGEGSVVASSKGSKYHYPHCSGAKQIKEENKIVFNSKELAEAAGYTLAANCKPR
jgi:hypothetical protein